MGIENWILKFADDTKFFSELFQVKDCDKLQKDLGATGEVHHTM